EDGVLVLRPDGLPGVEVRRWREGGDLVWRYQAAFTARLRRQNETESPAVANDLSEQLVDALNGAYGVHAGHRAAHAKGVLCAATFTPTPAAGAMSRAAHLQGDQLRAHVRFSNGGGNPTVPDTTRDARGIALKVYLRDGATTEVIGITLPVFFVRTPEDLIAFNAARAADPATGEPDMGKVG